jgi:hypothetical protein
MSAPDSAGTPVGPIDLLEWTDLVYNSASDGAPIVVASAESGGYPDMSYKGSMMVWDRDHLAWWEWSRGEQIAAIERSPRVCALYRHMGTRVWLRWYGEATVVSEGPLREAIMARTNERELANDPERRGVGVMMRVDRVRSRGQVIQLREGSGAASG